MAVVITEGLVLNAAVPLTHARIGYDSIGFLSGATVTASSETDGFPDDAPLNPLTYDRWKPASVPATWEIDAGTGVSCDFCGIAAHTMGTNGNTVTLQYYDGANWQDIDDAMPADDNPMMFLFEAQTAQRWRLSITGGSAPYIGVVYIGTALAMQRAIYGGHAPGPLSRQTTILPNGTERGEWVGRTVLRRGVSASFEWKNLAAGWYRDNFDPFVAAAIDNPFFIAWRPETFPAEVMYASIDGGVSPSNQGQRDLMTVSIQANGYVAR